MEPTLGGLLGAVAGTAVGAVNYALFIGIVERSLRRQASSQSEPERSAFEQRLAVLRRAILGADVLLLGGVGYWLGSMFLD